VALKILFESVGEVGEWFGGKIAGGALDQFGISSPAEAKPVGLTADGLKLQQANELIKAYRQLAMAGLDAGALSAAGRAADQITIDIQNFRTGQNKHPFEKLEGDAKKLLAKEGEIIQTKVKVADAEHALWERSQQVMAGADAADANELEKDIWVQWLAGLSDEEVETYVTNSRSGLQGYLRQIGVLDAEGRLGTYDPYKGRDIAKQEAEAAALLGKTGLTMTPLEPQGEVAVDGQNYAASAAGSDSIPEGAEVRVVGTAITPETPWPFGSPREKPMLTLAVQLI
jgi:hypothetical protein